MAGVRLLPFLAAIICMSVLNGVLMPKLGPYMPWHVFGTATMVTGSALMLTINLSTPESHIYGLTALIGIGCRSYFTAGITVVQTLVPVSKLSNTVGFMATGQMMGQIVVLSISGALFQNIGSDRLRTLLPDLSSDEILQLTTGANSPVFQGLGLELQPQVIEEVTLAIRNVFAVILATTALGLVGSVFMSRQKLYR
ncbi:hypothetical protein GGS23DRAFT_590658 [Durotheca rogersii]|uniref:uncharacterized protein n=1 Tax=Durotheca rogersii TaxID=419775 RepID=UPI00221FC409|nr:uncharacterized protein GGS23DRAFT_590658 [Durotheca rogersii]KAI5854505.1 hypothetical protein GGS23DRAFT_590658 [Durotheca rogersii]